MFSSVAARHVVDFDAVDGTERPRGALGRDVSVVMRLRFSFSQQPKQSVAARWMSAYRNVKKKTAKKMKRMIACGPIRPLDPRAPRRRRDPSRRESRDPAAPSVCSIPCAAAAATRPDAFPHRGVAPALCALLVE